MNYYRAIIEYDGTDYAGFQWQKDIPSIQNDLNQAIKKLIPGKVTTMGTSRTDTGVHALYQVVKVTSQNPITSECFIHELNQMLPSQIRCRNFSSCAGGFRPEIHAHSKEYRYYFTNFRKHSGLDHRFIANFHLELDLDVMRACLPKIVGSKDFQNFCSTGSNIKTTKREIYECELESINPHTIFNDTKGPFSIPSELSSCYQFKIVGNGFLKQMVRHLISALWSVGSGKINPADFNTLLDGPKIDKRLWKVAPPNGLFLYQINFFERINR